MVLYVLYARNHVSVWVQVEGSNSSLVSHVAHAEGMCHFREFHV